MRLRFVLAFSLAATACRGSSEPAKSSETRGSAAPTAAVTTWDQDAERGFAIWEQGKRREDAGARRLFANACAHGSNLGCTGLAAMDLRAGGDTKTAIARLTSACEAAIAPACSMLASAYDNGTGVPRDDAKAVQLARGACDAGQQSACVIYARAMLFGDHGVTRDPKRTRELAAVACERGVAPGCTLVGLTESGALQNAVEAERWLLRGCEGGDSPGCAAVAYQYFNGGLAGEAKGVPVDAKRGVEFATRACDLESPIGCALLARALDGGQGVARDVDRARQLAAKACTADEPAGCAIAATIAQHEGKADDATAFLARSCALGNRAACR